MSQVFLSYSNEDRTAVLSIIEAIEKAGLSVLWWERDATDGQPLTEVLQHQLEIALCVVVLWSKAATQSKAVQEAITAWSSGRLVLAALDDTPLPVGLRDLSVIRIQDASGTKCLIECIHSIISSGTARRPASPLPSSDQSATGWRFIYSVLSAVPKGVTFLLFGINKFVAFSFFLLAVAVLLGGVGLLIFPLRPLPTLPPSGINVSPWEWNEWKEPEREIALALTLLALGAAMGAWGAFLWTRKPRRRLTRLSPARAVSATMTAAPQVFVSYSRQDERTVERLAQQIEQLGYAVWIDRQSSGSHRYAAPIVQAIRMSKLVALMCSHHAFASDHVIREVYVAGDCKKPFIAFQLDQSEFPDEFLYFISGFPRVPVATIDQQQLRSEIARLVTV